MARDRAHVYPRTPAAYRAGWMPAHRPQEHRDREVLDASYTWVSWLAVGCVRWSLFGHHAAEYRAVLGAVQCLGALRRPLRGFGH